MKSIQRWIGLFGDLSYDLESWRPTQNTQERLEQVLVQAQLADELWYHLIMLGEHHREDYAIASPEIVLASMASVTKNIRLASGVSIISSTDPVKLYQDFATLDLLSNGRAEITAGRGSFTESFPLFGYNLENYASLFSEKLELLLKLQEEKKLTWTGRHRAPLVDQKIYPQSTHQEGIPIWIAVWGTQSSVIRAAQLGLPIIFAIIGGMWQHFLPLIELYRAEYLQAWHDPEKIQIGAHMHTLITQDETTLIQEYAPYYLAQMDRVGASRGWSRYTLEQFKAGLSPQGAICMGTADRVKNKIHTIIDTLGLTRFVAHMDIGWPNQALMLESIRLFAEEIMQQN